MPSLGFKICFVDTETEDHRTARRIEGQWIDLGLLRGCLMACEKEHGNDCEPPLFKRANAVGSGAELRTLRMVNVEEICVVDAPDECRYLALSYVWGKAREGIFTLKRGDKTALMTRGGLFPARWSISDTVWDAVQFVKGIRERYLWVDSLCIYSDRSLIKHLGNLRCLLPHFEEWSKW